MDGQVLFSIKVSNDIPVPAYASLTFTHLPDLLHVQLVALLIHIRSQEVLEPVVDLSARPQLGDPLGDGVAPEVLQVLDGLQLLIGGFGAALRGLLGEPPPP